MNLGAQRNNNVTPREIEDMKEFIKRQEERIHNLETKAIQLINLYFVFQGVILSSTSSTSHLQCRHWRIPFVLSLFVTLLNGYAFFVIIYAILRASDELDINEAELVVMRHRVRINNQQQQQAGQNNNRPRPDVVKKGLRCSFALLASGLFVGFSVVVLYGCVEFLCHSDHK